MKNLLITNIKKITLISIIILIVLISTLFLQSCSSDFSTKKENTIVENTTDFNKTSLEQKENQETEITEAENDAHLKEDNICINKPEDKDKNNNNNNINIQNNYSSVTNNNEVLFTFTVCGDNRPADDYLPQPEVFLKILENIKNQDIAFHISVGDIINGQTSSEEVIKRQFSDYLEAVKILPVTNFVAPGNHDVANETTRKYFLEMIANKAFQDAVSNGIQIFTADNGNNIVSVNKFLQDDNSKIRLYYYFKYMGVYFIVLNAFEKGYWGAIKGDQLEWLEKVLESFNLKDEKVFVFIHTPVYSVLNPDTITDGSKHVAFSSKKNLNYIRELFKKYKIDGVFSGHEHMYNKQFHDGTTFIITALSGEYPFVPREEGGFYHFIRVDIKNNSWLLNVIESNGNVNYMEEIIFN